jgi:hypothetical protein
LKTTPITNGLLYNVVFFLDDLGLYLKKRFFERLALKFYLNICPKVLNSREGKCASVNTVKVQLERF